MKIDNKLIGKNIYINGNFFALPDTGVKRFAIEITKTLIRIRQDVKIIIPQDVQAKGVPQEKILLSNGKSGNFWEQFLLPKVLKKLNYPLLLSLTNSAPIFYSPQIVTLHDILYRLYPSNYSFQFRTLHQFMDGFLHRKSLKILCVSSFEKSQFIYTFKTQGEKYMVVNNAASDVFFKQKSFSSFSRFFMAFSSQYDYKNIDNLIKGFMNHKQMFADTETQLYLIGNPRKYDNVSDLEESGVIFLGRVSDEKLRDYYNNALAFIFPSFYEGFGIPPIEAQKCGCPVIASNMPPMTEVLQNSALYFDPYDVKDISRQISQIVNRSSLRDELISRGDENARRFSWEKSALKVSNLIETVMTTDNI